MTGNGKQDGSGIPEDLSIPDFLKRQQAQKPATKESEVDMARVSEVEQPNAVVPPPVSKRKPKANGDAGPQKAAGKAKTAKGAKAAPKAAKPPKATAKPAKGKAKAETDKFGLRAGSLKSKAAAMYASKGGATMAEVKAALGSVQLNVLTELKAKGYKYREIKEKGKGARQVTRYFLQS